MISGRHAILPVPRGADSPETQPMPIAAITPHLPVRIPRRTPRYLAGARVRTDTLGHVVLDGTPGEHLAGLLDVDPPADPLTDELVADLTATMQVAASRATLARYSDLLPYLAEYLVRHGWVDGRIQS